MSMQKTYTEWIRLMATPTDKAMLDAITTHRNNAGFSETVRQLIREEADRRGVIVVQRASQHPHSEQAA